MSDKRPMRKIYGKRAAEKAAQQPKADTIERAAPGNGAAQSTSTGGTSTLNNNTTAPRPRKAPKRQNRAPKRETITAHQQTAKEARQEKREHAQTLKAIAKEKRRLQTEFKATDFLAKRAQAKVKAAQLSGDKEVVAKARAEYTKVAEKRSLNARRRAGLTRSEQSRSEKITQAEQTVAQANSRIEYIRTERHKAKAVKVQQDIQRQKQGTPQNTFPNTTTMGGDTYTNAADNDSDDFIVEEVNPHSPERRKLARKLLDRQAEQELPPARRVQHSNRIGTLLTQVEDAGIEVQFNGVLMPATQALDAGMDPDVWWHQVKDNFHSNAMDKFPYKGFIRFR